MSKVANDEIILSILSVVAARFVPVTHVLLTASSAPGADGQNAPPLVAQVARRRGRGLFPFMLSGVELRATSAT